MKRIGTFILLLLVLTGCGNKEVSNNVDKKENNVIKDEIQNEPKDNYVDDNPIKLGFYLYKNKSVNRKLITNYDGNFLANTDIGSFEVFFTQDTEIDSDYFQNTWKKYFDTYTDISDYHVGYHINFELNDGTIIDKNLLKPNDGDSFFDYIQTYMYDDVNKEIGQWYSHVTQDEYNENVILSSIKLTGSTKIDEVKSPINLEVFTYNSEDDFKDDKYRGNSSYKITITKTN